MQTVKRWAGLLALVAGLSFALSAAAADNFARQNITSRAPA